MLRTLKKRGQPRKYDTPEDKAKQDVAAKRAKRLLQKQPTHGDISFPINVSQQTEALPPAPSQSIESYEANPLGDPSEADSSSINAVVAGGEQPP
ncbi:hypothetical protein SNK03_000003 [Fusarium graminearum]